MPAKNANPNSDKAEPFKLTVETIRLSLANYEDWLCRTVVHACVSCQKRPDSTKQYYLHHKEGGLTFFTREEGTPEGWTLSHNDPVLINVPYHELLLFVMNLARKLPCLPNDLASQPETAKR